MSKGGKILLMIGSLILALTIFLFIMTTKDITNVKILYCSFIVFAEIVLFGGMIFMLSYSSKTEQVMFYSGNMVVLSFYSAVSIFISLFYLGRSLIAINNFWTIQVILFVIMAIFVTLITFVAGNEKRKKDSNGNLG